MLMPFGQDIWIADGPEVTAFAGFRYPTRMSIVRLPDGGLFIWSPVALSDPLRRDVDVLGSVRHIVAPNHLHHLSIPDWAQAYPDAAVYAPPGLRAKRPDIEFTADLGDQPVPGWAGAVDQVVMVGNRIMTEVVFFHRASGTALFADLIQHLPRGWFRGWRALVARADLMTGAAPAVPRKFRAAFTDRAAARGAVRALIEWPTQAVIMAHGPPVAQGGADMLARTFRWLRP